MAVAACPQADVELLTFEATKWDLYLSVLSRDLNGFERCCILLVCLCFLPKKCFMGSQGRDNSSLLIFKDTLEFILTSTYLTGHLSSSWERAVPMPFFLGKIP